jgi:phytanoyl-CoA hydroxylase
MPALTAQQVEQFHKQGYLVGDVVFDDDETAALAQAYDDCLQAMRARGEYESRRHGHLPDGTATEVYQIRAAHRHHPRFDALIRDTRLLDVVEALLGPDLKLILCQGLYKPPHTGGEIAWHQDDYYFRVSGERPVVSCWVSFDAATVDNGCMWVLPGQHDRLREHESLGPGGFAMIDADEARAVPVELAAGQVMFHHGAIPHRTLPNTTDGPRRAMAMHYMDAHARPLGGNREAEPADNMPVVRGG